MALLWSGDTRQTPSFLKRVTYEITYSDGTYQHACPVYEHNHICYIQGRMKEKACTNELTRRHFFTHTNTHNRCCFHVILGVKLNVMMLNQCGKLNGFAKSHTVSLKECQYFFGPFFYPTFTQNENVCWFYCELTLVDNSIKCQSKLDVWLTSVPSRNVKHLRGCRFNLLYSSEQRETLS
jgi:hypothetical protein